MALGGAGGWPVMIDGCWEEGSEYGEFYSKHGTEFQTRDVQNIRVRRDKESRHSMSEIV
jgi:hypothetical protein